MKTRCEADIHKCRISILGWRKFLVLVGVKIKICEARALGREGRVRMKEGGL